MPWVKNVHACPQRELQVTTSFLPFISLLPENYNTYAVAMKGHGPFHIKQDAGNRSNYTFLGKNHDIAGGGED